MWGRLRSSLGYFNPEETPLTEKKQSIVEETDESSITSSHNSQQDLMNFDSTDFKFFIIQLALILVICFASREFSYNHYTATISSVFMQLEFPTSTGETISFAQIRNVAQLWDYITGPLLRICFENSVDNRTIVLLENVMTGVPRIRQVRVKSDTCNTAAMFDDMYKTCYDYYSDEIADKEPFGLKGESWTYKPSHPFESTYHGRFGTYGGGGFRFDFDKSKASTEERLLELRDNVWIREGTRAVIIGISIYAPNANILCSNRIVFELPPTGGLQGNLHVNAVKIFLYASIRDLFVLGCDLVFAALTFYLAFVSVRSMVRTRRFFTNKWDIYSKFIVLYCFFVVGYTIYHHWKLFVFQNTRVAELVRSTEHWHFAELKSYQENLSLSRVVLFVLLWIKSLKFIIIIQKVNLIMLVIFSVSSELLALTLLVIVVMIGFAVFGTIIFGDDIVQTNSFFHCMYTFLTLNVGGLYFHEKLDRTWPAMGSVYFSTYLVTVQIILFSGFVALLAYSYGKVIELKEDADQHFLDHEIQKACLFLLAKLKRQDLIRQWMRSKKISKNKDEYDAFQRILKKRGLHGLEIQLIFKLFGVARGQEIKLKTMDEIYDSIFVRNQLAIESLGHTRIANELDKIERALEYCDYTLIDLLAKAEEVADKVLLRKLP